MSDTGRITETAWERAVAIIEAANAQRQKRQNRLDEDAATGTPKGSVKLESFGDGEIWLKDGWVIVLGQPQEGDGHNCDQMGCGWNHVLVRAKLP